MRRSPEPSLAACFSPLSRRWFSFPPCIGYCAAEPFLLLHHLRQNRIPMQLYDSVEEQPAIQDESAKMDGSGRGLKMLAGIFVAVLLIGFIVVQVSKTSHENALARMTLNAAAEPPAVEVITVQSAPSSLPLMLPGETAAWYEST